MAARPQLAAGSPEPPTGGRPTLKARVFLDTTAILPASTRLPLLVATQYGQLRVSWSPWVIAETARVATREHAIRALRKELRLAPNVDADALPRILLTRIAEVREEIDRLVAAAEQYWHTPTPGDIGGALRRMASMDHLPADLKDHPVLAGAIATRSRFLLSSDTKSFGNGRKYGSVACWHPDTFLTEYFRLDADLYMTAVEECAALKPGIDLLPTR